MEFQIETTTLDPGDSLLLFTDGITDALSPSQELFGEPRLVSTVSSPALSASLLIQNVMSSIVIHIAGREQYDDVTLLAVHRQLAENR